MLGLAGLLAAALGVAAADPTDADWEWLKEHREAALEELMPVAGAKQAYVTYRSYRDLYHQTPEQYFSVRGRLEALEALLVTPEGASVQEQLLKLHMVDHEASLADIMGQVQVRRRRVVGSSCAAVKQRLDRLAAMNVRLPERDLMVLHPTLHRLLIGFEGGTADLVLVGDDHPLVVWAIETIGELRRCPEAK
jgi:hypothetical protein